MKKSGMLGKGILVFESFLFLLVSLLKMTSFGEWHFLAYGHLIGNCIAAVVLLTVVWFWKKDKIDKGVVCCLSCIAWIATIGISVFSYIGIWKIGSPNSVFYASIISCCAAMLIFIQILAWRESGRGIVRILFIIYIILALIIAGKALIDCVGELFGGSGASQYEEVMSKNPNDWSESDRKYIDGLFNWIDKQDK